MGFVTEFLLGALVVCDLLAHWRSSFERRKLRGELAAQGKVLSALVGLKTEGIRIKGES